MVPKVDTSPLVIAADQLAQAAERVINCVSSNPSDYPPLVENFRTALANYKRVREG